jgi:hypothetical protein
MDVEQLKIFKVNVVEGRDVKRKRIPSFHELMGPILTGEFLLVPLQQFHARLISLVFTSFATVAQCFGHLPASGILQASSNNIYFKWSTFRVIYAMTLIAIGTFEVTLMFMRAFKNFTIIQVGEIFNFPFQIFPINFKIFQN